MDIAAKLESNQFEVATSEHITISSDPLEEDIAQDTPGKTTLSFSQSSKARNETRSFTIFDERFLTVYIEQPRSGKKEYQFDLAFLDPTPSRFSGLAWRWLYTTIALTTISIIAFGISWASGTPLLDQRWLPVDVLLGFVTILAFLIFKYHTIFTLTFYSLHGRTPLVEMAAGSPKRSAVESFILELQRHIEAARNAHWKDKPQFLRDELRAHYRLWEEGVLSDEVYEAGKERILEQHG